MNRIIILLFFPLLTVSNSLEAQVSRKNERSSEMSEKPFGTTASKSGNDLRTLRWEVHSVKTLDERMISYLTCDQCQVDPVNYEPTLSLVERIENNKELRNVSLKVLKEVEVNPDESKVLSSPSYPSEYKLDFIVRKSAGDPFVIISMNPVRKAGGKWMKLIEYKIELITQPVTSSRDGGRSSNWKEASVLSSGDWYKIATSEDGIYKITYSFLNQIGMPLSNLPSSSIRMFGTGGGVLSKDNSDPRPDDLEEMAIWIEDGGDGFFNPGDYILFYGEDQVVWENQNQRYFHVSNPYSDSVYYFITTNYSQGPAKRINVLPRVSSNQTVSIVDYYDVYEEDIFNAIQSGRKWFGEEISVAGELDFGLSVPNIALNTNAYVKSEFIGRSVNVGGTSMRLALPNQNSQSASYTFASVGSFYGADFGDEGTLEIQLNAVNNNFLTKLDFNNSANPSAQAWVDFIEVNARRNLVFNPPFTSFSDHSSASAGARIEFLFSRRVDDLMVWDVTNPLNVAALNVYNSSNRSAISTPHDSLKLFMAFDGSSYHTPKFSGKVEQQNLHALRGIQYVVVTHPNFKTSAENLAEFHEIEDGFTTAVVTVGEIYNEFSGGAQDVTAIKEFMRMLYKRAEQEGGIAPEYLVLFGDASYDYKNRVAGNTNYVPAYQTRESLSATTSVVSDDFYGLLDDDEGEGFGDLLDIGIGRIPVKTKSEAQNAINKITHYASKRTFGEWRNRIVFVADDEDGRTYMSQSDILGNAIDTTTPVFNIDKIYLDAYKQVSGAGGERYPDAKRALNDRIERGALVMYYIGHGGELGWAHERLLEVVDVNGWQNFDNMPLLVTATCEFSRFDDPRRTSAGEFAFLNPSGGAIALLTTTRAVYAGPNLVLTKAFTNAAYDYIQDDRPRMGELCRITKVVATQSNGSSGANTRCFSLLGDPGLRLAYPENQVFVTNMPDTISALGKVKVEGYVADPLGNKLTSFNGIVYPLLFDKEATLKTLDNDGIGEHTYKLRKNILFRGKASVNNGEFEFEFVVPKDIDQNFGEGKLSFYADNGETDATGADLDFIVGGVSDSILADENGPDLDLFMNNNKFVFGGLTDENPDLYAEVWDENGINMVGNGIGHDITAVLDEDTKNTIILNDFYESDLDSYQSGKIRYPFEDLEEGRHTLKIQVWDVNNNPSDAVTEFVVADNEELALAHILNYPNPFTTNTSFFFEHNKPGQSLDIRIEVFTVSGKLVKTIDTQFSSDGYRVGPIAWDGKDEYGDKIGRGVYVYRLSVKTPVGERANEFERLVILN